MDPIRLLRQHWRPAAVAALLMLATVAWYAWPFLELRGGSGPHGPGEVGRVQGGRDDDR
jgi:hypothetical protein